MQTSMGMRWETLHVVIESRPEEVDKEVFTFTVYPNQQGARLSLPALWFCLEHMQQLPATLTHLAISQRTMTPRHHARDRSRSATVCVSPPTTTRTSSDSR